MSAIMRAVAFGLAVLGAAIFAVPANAQTQQQEDWCVGEGNVSEEVQIAACTVIINSGNYDNRDLNTAYFHRGYSYAQSGQCDRAIADFTEAIRRIPTDADAYWARHICKETLGDMAGGKADEAMARKLDPDIERHWQGPDSLRAKPRGPARPFPLRH